MALVLRLPPRRRHRRAPDPPGAAPDATLRRVEIATSEGMAHVTVDEPAGARSVAGADQARGRPAFLLVLTHGAGGGVGAPDLLAARDAALRLGGVVARVTQPYQVKGRRVPGSAVRQDAAWVEVVMAMRDAVDAVFEVGRQEPEGRRPGYGIPLIQGGRSSRPGGGVTRPVQETRRRRGRGRILVARDSVPGGPAPSDTAAALRHA